MADIKDRAVYCDEPAWQAFIDIVNERRRQEVLLSQGKFPFSCNNPNIPDITKLGILAEEFGEAAKEASQIQEQYDRRRMLTKPLYLQAELRRNVHAKRALLREELIQVAAVCVAWCEALDVQAKEYVETNPRIEAEPIVCSCGTPGCPTGPECFGGSDYHG